MGAPAHWRDWLERFEDAWQRPLPPDLAEFAAAACGEGAAASDVRDLLRELVGIDLELRWRRSGRGADNPLLETYWRRFPELGVELPLDAILDEYRVRMRWGDRPSHTDYFTRFPAQAAALREALPCTDVELAAEPLRRVESSVTVDSDSGRPEVAESGPPAIPGYDTVEEIARGGMGAVFRLRDPSLNREVAVKVLLPDHRGSSEGRQRFLEEARITAQLQHPGIPPVHELGQLADGSPYLVLKLIQGRTLADLLAARPEPSHDRGHFLSIFERIGQTVAFAHARGVIHRDLKPSNVMVGAFGEVQVMDWGLAKEMRNAECGVRNDDQEAAADRSSIPNSEFRTPHSPLTEAGSVVGTLAYMPPEQAAGRIDEVDRRSDAFGLGAILCAILTGQPPYFGSDFHAVRKLAASGTLDDAFARLDACGADAELIGICKACLSRDADARPADAGAVAERITAYRSTVEARLRAAELARNVEAAKVSEQKKRRRLLRRAAVAGGVMLVACLAVVTFFWFAERRSRQQAELTAYRLAIRDIDRALSEGRPDKALAVLDLCTPSHRNWEWHYLKRRCGELDSLIARSSTRVVAVAPTSDGRRVRFVDNNAWLGEADLAARTAVGEPWRAVDGQKVPTSGVAAKFDAEAKRVAILNFNSDAILVWDLESRSLLRRIKVEPASAAILAISPDGLSVACANAGPYPHDVGRVHVWSVGTGERRCTFTGHGQDEANNKADPLALDKKESRNVLSMAFSPNGKRIASGTRFQWRTWDAATGKTIGVYPAHDRTARDELYGVTALAFAGPDGQTVLTGGNVDNRIRDGAEILRHDLSRPSRPVRLAAYRNDYTPFAVSRDGQRFACPAQYMQVVVRESDTGQEVAQFSPPVGLESLAFSSDGRQLIGGSGDGAVRAWDLTAEAAHEVIRTEPEGRTYGLAVADAGRTLLFTSARNTPHREEVGLWIWDRVAKQPAAFIPLQENSFVPSVLALSPDESLVAVGMHDGPVQLWDWRKRQPAPVPALTGNTHRMRQLRFLNDRQMIASTEIPGASGSVLYWDLDRPAEPRELYFAAKGLGGFAVSPDGGMIAVSNDEGGAAIAILRRDGDSWPVARTLPTDAKTISALAFSPDGRTLAAVTMATSTVQLWNVNSGRLLARSEEVHESRIRFILYSADGTRLFTGSDDRTVKVWDVRDAVHLLTLRGHTGAVNRGVVIPDGTLFTTSWDCSVRVWDGRVQP